jgi:spore germination cell wall hydrolase CwlJ-like protein
MNLNSCRQAFSAALIPALCAALILPLPATAGTASAVISRTLLQEQIALDSSSARLKELTSAVRPRARDEAFEVAARETATAAPARLDFPSIDAMPGTTGDAQWQCLAEAIYFEARGEPIDGQIAVAEVVLNRTSDRHFPNSVCGVTKQGAGSGRGCQFSYACDGNSDVMKSAVPRTRAEKLATLVLSGHAPDVTEGATYFHTRSIRPSWSSRMTRTASIGHHHFYRAGTQVAAAD